MMRHWMCLALFGTMGVLTSITGAAARPPSSQLLLEGGARTECETAIDAIERRSPVPKQLIRAISLIESGRTMPGGRVAAWPWTINVGGVGTFFETADAAVAAVESLRSAGVRSIDVGCMQINLMHHPNAFATLHEAFDPAANTEYANKFLLQLYAELGGWPKVAAAYHSRTADLAAEYARKVAGRWPNAGAFGLSAAAAITPGVRSPDPYSIYTPEFTAKLRLAAADRAARDNRLTADLHRRQNLQGSVQIQRPVSHLRLAQNDRRSGPSRSDRE